MARNRINMFGELEAEIMDIVWDSGTACVRDVLERLAKKRKIAYTTVMTVMTRLADKKVLTRTMDKSGAFVYIPTKDKKTFMKSASEKLIKDFLTTYGDVAIAQFMDIMEKTDAKQSEQWKEKLKTLIA
ncbi:BlaI/MecI/CopY family transcriptional regulator [Candidatus Uhrbacteria bacterium]|nr:BlaI/MecI/CopY family transcriptional regulator [Candidatus Uhrbacteria bacterium]